MEVVSRLLVLSPDSQYSPSYLARAASALENNVFIKQTCYGILLEGEKEDVNYVSSELKKIDPNRIFTKIRAFPLGDKRRCRANKGSARPGFYFLEKEIDLLPSIVKGLESPGDTKKIKLKNTKKITPEKFKEIMEKSI